MPDPPDRLNPPARAFAPQDGSAAPTHTSGAASTATSAPAEARTDGARPASPKQAKTLKNSDVRSENYALKQENAALRADLAKVTRERDRLQKPPPTAAVWLEAEMKDTFAYLSEYIEKFHERWEQVDEEMRLFRLNSGQIANEQRAINAIIDVVEKATDSSRDTGFSQSDIKLVLQDEAAIKEVAQALSAQESADRKLEQQSKRDQVDASRSRAEDTLKMREATQELWYTMLKDFHYLAEVERRRELAKLGAAAAPPDHRRFTLADPEMVERLKEERLTGYLECARSFDHRAAAHSGVKIADSEVAYLKTVDHPECPYQKGLTVGKMMGWRALCHALQHPEWDHSLSPRKWSWEDFWPKVATPLEGGFWDGAIQGSLVAQEKFLRRCEGSVESTASGSRTLEQRLGEDEGHF